MLRYKTHADNGSMFNTPPPTRSISRGQVFKTLKRLGGIGEMEKINPGKGGDAVRFPRSSLFQAFVAGADRSMMNVPFVTGDAVCLTGNSSPRRKRRALLT